MSGLVLFGTPSGQPVSTPLPSLDAGVEAQAFRFVIRAIE
jgi:hypothetical protein